MPSKFLRRRHCRVLLVLALVVLAGCSGILADDQSLPDADEAGDQYESLDAYRASFITEMRTDNGTERWEGTLVVRPGTGELYQNVSRNGTQSFVYVSNGSVQWVYDRTNENVTRIDGPTEASYRRQRIERVVGQVSESDNRTIQPGIPTAPVVPSGAAPPGETIAASTTTVRYEGIEPVGERRAHVIVVETTPDAEFEYRRVLYLDTEWFVIIRGESERVVDGTRYRSEFRLENLTFNPDISAERFEFDPPEETTVTARFDRERYGTREALADAADRSVPDPAVPERFDLRRAQRSVSDTVTTLSLRYASDTETLIVGKRAVPGGHNLTGDGDSVRIGNQTGVYRQTGSNGFVEWTCDGVVYTVGGQLPKERLIAIAESVECA